MSYDVILTHARSLDDRADAPPVDARAFAQLMAQNPLARRRDEATWWVFRNDDEPWFAASVEENEITLSVSYSNTRFIRDFVDMVELSVGIADALALHAIDEASGTVLHRDILGELLAPRGRHVQSQVSAWSMVMDKIDGGPHGPLEFPLGPTDLVTLYFLFHVTPARPLSVERVTEHLSARLGADHVHAMPGANAFSIGRPADVSPARPMGDLWVRVLLRPDGKWQVWPAARARFSSVCRVGREVAEELHRLMGGDITFLGMPFDAALGAELKARESGLGIEFYLWTRTLAARGM